jgi:ABC-2 type transport system permease protein
MRARSSYRGPIAKWPRLLWRLVCVGFKIETEFRTDLILSIIHFVLYQALYVTFWQAIVGRTGVLGTWTQGELVTLSLVVGLHYTLAVPFLGFRRLPERVRHGELDKYLCRPVSPILLLCFESIHVTFLVRGLIADVVALAGCVWYFSLPVTLWWTVLALLLLLSGVLVWTFINGTVALLSFWMGKVQVIGRFVNFGRWFERYPTGVFPGSVQQVLTWVLPVSLIATYPTRVFLGKAVDVGRAFAVSGGMCLLWGAAFTLVSRRALARYEAFGG